MGASISFARAEARFRSLVQAVPAHWYGREVDTRLLQDLSKTVCWKLSSDNYPIHEEVVRVSLAYLSGQVLTQEVAEWAYRFLSVNHESLVAGRPAIPATEGTPTELTPLQFRAVISDRVNDQPFYRFDLRVVWGPWFDRQVMKLVSPVGRQLDYLLYRMGVSRRNKLGASPRDLIQLYTLGLLEQRKPGDPLTFHKVELSSYLEDCNRQMIAQRRQPCPRGYTHRCSQCPVGYDQCPSGTKPQTTNAKGIVYEHQVAG